MSGGGEVGDGSGYILTEEHEDGAYAEGFTSWHTPYSIVLDFLLAPEADAEPRPGAPPTVSRQVSARVRLPMALAFELIREVSGTMTDYERVFGEIHQPHPREEGGR